MKWNGSILFTSDWKISPWSATSRNWQLMDSARIEFTFERMEFHSQLLIEVNINSGSTSCSLLYLKSMILYSYNIGFVVTKSFYNMYYVLNHRKSSLGKHWTGSLNFKLHFLIKHQLISPWSGRVSQLFSAKWLHFVSFLKHTSITSYYYSEEFFLSWVSSKTTHPFSSICLR